MSTNPYAPPQATVADVPVQGIVKADRGMRLLAAILDGIIAGIITYTPVFATGSFGGLMEAAAAAGNPQHLDPMTMFALMKGVFAWALVGWVIWGVITYILVQRNGQTIAKKMLGIKVVRADGSRASVGRIFWLRNVVNTLISVIPLVGALYVLLDALWIFGEERRCLHDKIADTIVVNA